MTENNKLLHPPQTVLSRTFRAPVYSTPGVEPEAYPQFRSDFVEDLLKQGFSQLALSRGVLRSRVAQANDHLHCWVAEFTWSPSTDLPVYLVGGPVDGKLFQLDPDKYRDHPQYFTVEYVRREELEGPVSVEYPEEGSPFAVSVVASTCVYRLEGFNRETGQWHYKFDPSTLKRPTN